MTYVVQSYKGISCYKFYTDDLKKAEEVYFEECNKFDSVEILYWKGPGCWETVKEWRKNND